MSPRAAWRLEMLGFDAYDYVPGKQDWLAFGLDYAGEARLAGSLVTGEVATCSPADRVGDVRGRLRDLDLGVVVVNAESVVLGRLGRDALDADSDLRAADVMVEGPTTVRPSEEVEALTGRMRRAGVEGVLVTRSDGTLLGIFERRRGEQTADDEESRHADR